VPIVAIKGIEASMTKASLKGGQGAGEATSTPASTSSFGDGFALLFGTP
jgi:hypothetical protein